MFGRHKAEIEECAIGLTLALRPACDLLLQTAGTPIAPGDRQSGDRAQRATLRTRGLAAYALLRAVVLNRRFGPRLEQRCLDQIEYLLAEHEDFADFQLDQLALQEYWQRVCTLQARKRLSVWFCIAEAFADDLGGGGLRGGDAFMVAGLTHIIAEIGRVYQRQLKQLEKQFRFV